MDWKDYDLTPDRLALDCTEVESDEYNRIQGEALRYHFWDNPEVAGEHDIALFIGANWLTWLRSAMKIGG